MNWEVLLAKVWRKGGWHVMKCHYWSWNSRTGQDYGLANDDLDINSVFTRLFSEEDHVAKAAEKVNLWMYTGIVDEKLKLWLCSHFMNDGSLTIETMLRQFLYVVWGCESINSRVRSGLVMVDLQNCCVMALSKLKLSKTDSWMGEDMCRTANVWDPSCYIYIEFCGTHGIKAMRNQLLASKYGGTKAFVNEKVWLESHSQIEIGHEKESQQKLTYQW